MAFSQGWRHTRALGSIQRALQQTKTDGGYQTGSSAHGTTGFTYDFSQIPPYRSPQASPRPELTVNPNSDIYEQEAHRASDAIMQQPRSLQPWPEGGRKWVNDFGPRNFFHETYPSILAGDSSYGEPLDPAARAFMELRFGHDFSQIRVHTDSMAAHSAQAFGARAYTIGSHVVFGTGQYARTGDGMRLLAHELAHVVQQRRPGASLLNPSQEGGGERTTSLNGGAPRVPVRLTSVPGVIQCAPDTKSPAPVTKQPSDPKPAKLKHSLKVHVKIADDIVPMEGKYVGLFSTMPKELSNRLIGQIKGRLSFLADEGFQVSVEFGKFSKRELRVPGNIQVWLIDELGEKTKPGKIMTEQYGYKASAAKDVNESFENVTDPGPGRDFKEVAGDTVTQIDDSVPGTSEPVFVKIPFIFRWDELTHYKQGNKPEAELGIDEISATVSHELGHVLRAEPGTGHVKGDFNDGKQSFPPRLMDTIGSRGGWTLSQGIASPRLSTDFNDRLSKEAIDKLGGWPYVWDKLVKPNVGNDKLIRYAHVTPDGGLEVMYNFRNLGYTSTEQSNMIEFLKGIEMSEQNNKWKR
jgi:hypothetical protein